MNEIVADALASHYSSLNFLSLTAGCVQTIYLPGQEGTPRRIPGARIIYRDSVPNIISCENKGEYFPMVPTEEEMGILYFEDLGSSPVKQQGNFEMWRGNLMLVCWLNYKQIGDGNPIGAINGAIRSHLPRTINKSGYFLGGSMKFDHEFSKRPGPFIRYDYNEVEKQHLIYPFDYLSLRVRYTAIMSSECPVEIDVTPQEC